MKIFLSIIVILFLGGLGGVYYFFEYKPEAEEREIIEAVEAVEEVEEIEKNSNPYTENQELSNIEKKLLDTYIFSENILIKNLIDNISFDEIYIEKIDDLAENTKNINQKNYLIYRKMILAQNIGQEEIFINQAVYLLDNLKNNDPIRNATLNFIFVKDWENQNIENLENVAKKSNFLKSYLEEIKKEVDSSQSYSEEIANLLILNKFLEILNKKNPDSFLLNTISMLNITSNFYIIEELEDFPEKKEVLDKLNSERKLKYDKIVSFLETENNSKKVLANEFLTASNIFLSIIELNLSKEGYTSSNIYLIDKDIKIDNLYIENLKISEKYVKDYIISTYINFAISLFNKKDYNKNNIDILNTILKEIFIDQEKENLSKEIYQIILNPQNTNSDFYQNIKNLSEFSSDFKAWLQDNGNWK